MAILKTKDNQPWHICDDCIDSLADWLAEMVKNWNRPRIERPESRDIKRQYEKVNLDFAIDWLKLYESVAFAKDFEDAVREPVQRYWKLTWRAMQILDGDLDGTSTEVSGQPDAIRKAIAKRFYDEVAYEVGSGHFINDDHPEQVERFRDTDFIVKELEEGDGEVYFKFQDAVRYLRRVSVVLRARIDDRKVQRHEIPNGAEIEWSKLTSYKELREALVVSHNKLLGMLIEGTEPERGKIRFKRSSPTARKIQAAIQDLPTHVQARFQPGRKPS